jgi:hypothetical protein
MVVAGEARVNRKMTAAATELCAQFSVAESHGLDISFRNAC